MSELPRPFHNNDGPSVPIEENIQDYIAMLAMDGQPTPKRGRIAFTLLMQLIRRTRGRLCGGQHPYLMLMTPAGILRLEPDATVSEPVGVVFDFEYEPPDEEDDFEFAERMAVRWMEIAERLKR